VREPGQAERVLPVQLGDGSLGIVWRAVLAAPHGQPGRAMVLLSIYQRLTRRHSAAQGFRLIADFFAACLPPASPGTVRAR
jgi:hypothetical protein